MIKIEFPADRKDIALAIGQALTSIGQGAALANSPAPAGAPVHRAAPSPTLAEEAADAELDRVTKGNEAHYEAEAALDQAAVYDFEAEAAGKPAASAPAAGTTTGETQTADTQATTGASASERVDNKGVPFDASMCAKAEKPFYASGKNKGQWKKRGGENGPSEDEYDAWYAAELLKVTNRPATIAEPQLDVGSVWGAPKQETKAPSNAGEFFAWVSEMQTAGHITQADVDQAYPANNMTPDMIWTQPPEVQAQMFQALYATLSAKVPA